MAIQHMLVFSVIEGMVTAMLLKHFMKNETELIYAMLED